MSNDTIFALSSGSLPSGVAIIRISGPAVQYVNHAFLGDIPKERMAVLRTLREPNTGEVLDECLAIYFPGPNSFTGEDVLELHCHGGAATMEAVLASLAAVNGLRHAERGEFSRRAFENGRLDLTELEGLSDLISAQTQAQRRLALSQSGGALRELYENWRHDIIKSRALIEAELDFSDEDDVPGSVSDLVWSSVSTLKSAIENHLKDDHRGEIVRRGFRIALMGAPNAGKSSLLNALAKRDVAIVTPQAGTTRDTIEVHLRVGDHLAVLVDTAGLRDADDIVEKEGIKRALLAGKEADLVLWLSPSDDPTAAPDHLLADDGHDVLTVSTKNDLKTPHSGDLSINVKDQDGIAPLLDTLESRISSRIDGTEDAVLTRQRHRDALVECVTALKQAQTEHLEIELRSEHLRQAGDCLGRITGKIDVEDLLDVIFAEFCVGK